MQDDPSQFSPTVKTHRKRYFNQALYFNVKTQFDIVHNFNQALYRFATNASAAGGQK